MKRIYLLGTVAAVLCLSLFLRCTEQEKARNAARDKAADRTDYFVPKNDLDFHNYNRRQMLADDPTTILWCTTCFPIPNSPLITIPIVGKITSGTKRPFPDDPGPDGMYGPSDQYRYGFSPTNSYWDFFGMPVLSTTEPTVWQKEATIIVMQNDPALLKAHEAAREYLRQGKTADAERVLEDAIKSIRR